MRNENDGSLINTEIFFSGERESFWYHIAYNSKLSYIKGNSFLRLHDEISNPFHKWLLYPFSVDAIRNFMSEAFFYRCEFSAAQKFARQNREGGRRQKFALNDIRSNYIRISFWILPNMALIRPCDLISQFQPLSVSSFTFWNIIFSSMIAAELNSATSPLPPSDSHVWILGCERVPGLAPKVFPSFLSPANCHRENFFPLTK